MASSKRGSVLPGLAALALSVLLESGAVARELPPGATFDPYYLATATHVVVVSEGGKIDGRVTVLECWKGDLKRGDGIVVGGLASFAPEEARKVKRYTPKNTSLRKQMSRAASQTESWLKGRGPLFVADHVSCGRMVLFLNRPEIPQGKPGEGTSTASAAVKWVPAGHKGNIKPSVAWIEHGYAYVYTRFFNPGDVLLMGPLYSEKELKAKVMQAIERRAYEAKMINGAKTAAASAAELADPTDRVRSLVPFIRCDIGEARKAALQAVKKDGEAALPTLMAVFEDESLNIMIRSDALEATAAAGAKAGPLLLKIVEAEFEFWKRTGPGLRKGWWNNAGLPPGGRDTLRVRYSVMLSALGTLARIRFPECRRIVAEFRDFWRSLPQLEDKSGLTQMSEAADHVLMKQSPEGQGALWEVKPKGQRQ